MNRLLSFVLVGLLALGPVPALAQSGGQIGGYGVSCANPTGTAGPTAVNGSAVTCLRSDGAPAVQTGSDASLGIVRGDSTTITCPSGICSTVGSSGAWTKIVCNSPSGSGTTTFSSISGSYNGLQIRGYGATSAAASNSAAYLKFNSDTGSNYSFQQLNGSNGTPQAQSTVNAAPSSVIAFQLPGQSGPPANSGDTFVIDINGYAQTTFTKKAMVNFDLITSNTAGTLYTVIMAYAWNSTAAITQIDVVLVSGNWVSGSKVCLYGVS